MIDLESVVNQQPPRESIDATALGLDPDHNEGDRWLIESAHDDVHLLNLMVSKESLGRKYAEGTAEDDYSKSMHDLGNQITKRVAFLERPPRP